MISVEEIYNKIKNLADEKLAENWDNVGILLGDKQQEVKNILVCLDVTTDVVEEAISNNIDLIISHHPLIFKAIKKLQFDDFKSNIIKNLIKNDISVISAHTNLDSAEFGLNQYLANILNLKNIDVLFKNDNFSNAGLGRVGCLEKEMDLKAFISFVKSKFNLDYVKLISNDSQDKKINKVAILGGSGGSFIYDLPDVDIYLTGDVSYHEAQDSLEMGKTVLDIGHFSEIFCKDLLKNYLLKIYTSDELNINLSKVEQNPFKII
ncbi:Nif3-like dinuclear metal center hexameric protein [Gemella sp. zg-1178]|uniref:Nif3-like dinuclear metal center hexameric protein n=1 Tax=Gemella sp. zg-1178 TaxID=2840372 RepID=UPI001C040810|nr:Nif3-like dinuclear metal center hexameric protein [Gemella sp. zg-1178]MBU0278128.1 Nif3-like dinuclear metal center hexameric protein [Gemella sp. zg-1178]